MSRLIVVIMQENQYPFGQCDNSQLQKKKIMVRKIIQFHPFQKKNILLKAKKIKTFVNPYIIKLQQLLQEQSSLHLLFQYVPIKIQTWISNINSQFIQSFKLQLLQLADYLAENSILIDFKLKNIGMDQFYQPKYFIGLQYQINTLIGKDQLLQKYKAQINQIIYPYRLNNIPQQFNQKQIKKTKPLTLSPNPQFPHQKPYQNLKTQIHKNDTNKNQIKNQSLKRQNQKSSKQITISPQTPIRSSQHQRNNTSQRESIKKISNLNQYDLKLTFDGSQKVLFQNLPKNISTNIKIQNIGRKINDLKNMMQTINGKGAQRKHQAVSLSPMKGVGQERPSSSYQKGILKQQLTPSQTPKVQKQQKGLLNNISAEKINTKQLRQTQSESQYSHKLPKCSKGLDRVNQKMHIQQKNELRTKNEVRVNGNNKQSYIYEFQRLLNDDIDLFAVNQSMGETKQLDLQQIKNQLGSIKNQQKGLNQQRSPRFGLTSAPIQIQNFKTQPERFSYSHNTNNIRKRKKSSQSATSNSSEIQNRVNAVIGASRKLINNFRKSKAGQKKQFKPQ